MNATTHTHSIETLKKMSTSQLMNVYVSIKGHKPSEILCDRQSLVILLSELSSVVEEISDEEFAARHQAAQIKHAKLVNAEKNAAIPGWKRDGIRRWRKFGASWNEIAAEFGVHTNTCSNIVNGRIYKWDTDSDAKLNGVNELKPSYAMMLASVGIAHHAANELDSFFG